MNKEKQMYASPEAEVLVVQSEGVICLSNTNNANKAPAFSGYVDEGWD